MAIRPICALLIIASTTIYAQDFTSLKATDATDAVNTASGAITTPGGGSVGKNFYCGSFYVTTGATSNAGGHLFYQGSSDTSARLGIYNSGLLQWGPGSGPADTSIYRDSINSLTADATLSFLRPDGAGTIGMNRRTSDGSAPNSTRHRWQISYNIGSDFWRLEHYAANGAFINVPLAVNTTGDVTVDRQMVIGSDPSGTGLLRVGGGADIKGTIRTKEVIVTMSGWADHILAPDYQLLSLSDLRTFIGEHGHLPNVTDEATIARDGLAIADMQRSHMAKIEELTLYVLAADREATAQKTEIAQLTKDRDEVRERLERLEKILVNVTQTPSPITADVPQVTSGR